MKAKLSSIISNSRWELPQDLKTIFLRLNIDVLRISIYGTNDIRVWKPYLHGKFCVNNTYNVIRSKGCPQWWAKYVRKDGLHPRSSMWGWRVFHGAIPIEDNIKKKGIYLASWYRLCNNNEESLDHFLWSCKISVELWLWILDLFQLMFQQIKSYFWKHPNVGEVKINSDGSFRGNPGKESVGFIIRNHTGAVLRTYSQGLGNIISYMAECYALLQGLQDAASNGWLIAWSKSDSFTAVEAFNNDNVLWQLKGDLKVVKIKMQQTRITSS
ncbi:hypothetical protein GIB67_009290 [Kingdonia uniflora]|uniref:RNase H type-1 domain-containing protein n=1 Tax=Kingdonia uniflora TaxID=39325 RepID=A0A7J7N2I6_9MAGN|nr:hypothetical protein GIB67_009290 [Kingdonia uniflora]